MMESGREIGAVLDVGGGTGALSRLLIGRESVTRIVVLEPSIEMINLAPTGVEKWSMAIEDCPETRAFDTVIARQILHYVVDLERALLAIRMQMRRNSLAYVGQLLAPTEETALWLQNVARRISPDRRRVLTWNSLTRALARTGYEQREFRTTPYRESLRSWVMRSGSARSLAELMEMARMTATSDVIQALDIRGDDMQLTMRWANATFANMAWATVANA